MDIRKVKKLIELLDESGIAEIEITEDGPDVAHHLLALGDDTAVDDAARPRIETDLAGEEHKAVCFGSNRIGPSRCRRRGGRVNGLRHEATPCSTEPPG